MPACRQRRSLAAFCAVLAVCLVAFDAGATLQPAPSEGPVSRFAAHDTKSTQSYGYLIWTRILGTVIEEDGKGRVSVNYGGLGVDGRNALDGFVSELTSMPVSTLGRDEQLAYWLNLYNAASLRLMIDQFYAVGTTSKDFAGRNPYAEEKFSIKRLYTGKGNPWTVRNLTVEGTTLSLNDIEYRVLYAHWPSDPVVYGLSCPLRGCPSLPRQAFQGGQVHQQLLDAARRFIADDANVAVKADSAKVSELYEQPVFGGPAKVLEHLRQYADGPRKQELASVTRIAGYEFDWKLAGKQPASSARIPQGQINRGAGAGGSLQE